MCSVGDDFQEETIENFMEQVDIGNPKTCNKCREEKAKVLLRHKDGYCKTCFLNGTIHKFKAFLGKHRFVKKNDRVLVVFSFGHPTTSLLSFLRSGFNTSTPKQLKFAPLVLYVERNYHLNIEERKNILERIDKHIKHFKFEVYFVSFLQYVLHSNLEIKEDYKDLILNENDGEAIDGVHHHLISPTIEIELYKQLEYRLLLDCAKKLGCQHIFMPELAVDIASQILTNISLGKGNHLQMDVGICDTRDPDVDIIKPLRFFDIKELALYNFFNNINPITIIEKEKDPYLSMQNLMLHFVQNLQINFPSTITTVIKTGDKLSTDEEIWKNDRCELCLLPIESRNAQLTSAEATDFSHWLSTNQADNKLHPLEKYNQTLAGFQRKKMKYCFACSRISDYLIKEQL